ncbi:MAG: ABC transporter substrate-binding protein [Pirellulaceae bacterium]
MFYRRLIAGVLLCAHLPLLAGCSFGTASEGESELKVLRAPMQTDGPKSLDPVRSSSVYDHHCGCNIYEPLLQYKYLITPPTLEPLLLAEMPEVLEEGRIFRFKLKPGVRFHDDPCFPDGKGRELNSHDVFYSWKRMADSRNLPKSWWLVENTIKGFDEYRKEQNAAADLDGAFDYDAPVEGMRIINNREFELELNESVPTFIYKLAMYQLAIVPREAVEMYGDRFGRHPVGTGPFLLSEEEDWQPGLSMVLNANPNYHTSYYPEEHMPEDVAEGLTRAAGKRLPIVDRVEIGFYVEDQPRWLEFRSGSVDYITVPAEYIPTAFNKRTKTLKAEYRRQGVRSAKVPLLDFIFRGFNMEDELLGGYTPEKVALRKAICAAMDWEEQNDAFYNGINIVYDGMIPPDLDGYPKGGVAPNSYRGPNLQLARQLLAEAGYPEGKGLPPIEFYTSRGGNNQEQVEMLARQLGKINVELKPHLVDFSTLIASVDNKKAPMFAFAWGSDYPDAENNLALFYGPNESPGSNHYNYKRKEYDKLYEKARVMEPSPERTAIYEKMRDMVYQDAAFAGSMARTRYYLWNPRLKNFKPSEDFFNWFKYLDVDDDARQKS